MLQTIMAFKCFRNKSAATHGISSNHCMGNPGNFTILEADLPSDWEQVLQTH